MKALLVGLPATGKTTFLAALWHTVESEETHGSLRLVTLAGDREYLNRARKQWLSFEPVDRTSGGAVETVAMQLLEPTTEVAIDLAIPDLAGETFREQWVSRRWTSTFALSAAGADSVLVFIHPSRIVEPLTINELVESGALAGVPDVPDGEERPVEWSPENASTQVKIVELLQFAVSALSPDRPLKIAVIVSAWDVVKKQSADIVPGDWLRARLPLLSQFLASNTRVLAGPIYGVSAQGGDLSTDREQLIKHTNASERILIQIEANTTHDISAPIKWLMNTE